MKKPDKKIFGTLFFSIFAAVTGVGIVVPLLPVYANDMGASGLYIGMIFGAFSISRTFLLPYFGRLSDRKGRKPFILAGLLGYAIISLAFLLASSVEALVVIRFFQGIASAMMMPVLQAYVGDITPAGRESLTMGQFNMAMFIGLSVGPLLGGVINDRFGLQPAFLCMGVFALIGFFLSWTLLPPTENEHVVQRGAPPAAWRRLMTDREILGLSIFRFSYTSCIGIIWGFLPVLGATELGLSSSSIGFLVMLGVLISGLIHVPMGYVADRTNKRGMVIIGGIVVCFSMMLFWWATSLPWMMCASAIFGIGGGVSMPAHMGLSVLKGNDMDAMGSVMSVMTAAHSLGMLAGAILAGVMMDAFALRVAFPFGTAIVLTGTITFVILTKAIRNHTDGGGLKAIPEPPP